MIESQSREYVATQERSCGGMMQARSRSPADRLEPESKAPEMEVVLANLNSQVAMPKRSRLYHIKPYGLGTPYVESLTSYLSRLTGAHLLAPCALAKTEFAPRFGDRRLCYGISQQCSLFKNAPFAINGQNGTAEKCAAIAEALTGQANLTSLTMLSWKNMPCGDYRLHRLQHWCPACIREWEAERHESYFPLVWSIEIVSVCPRHKIRLENECPHCRCSFAVAPSRIPPGSCPRCGRWLGANSTHAIKETPPDFDLGFEVFKAKEMCALIGMMNQTPINPSLLPFARNCKFLVERYAEGNVRNFGLLVNRHHNDIYNLISEHKRPSFPLVLSLCYWAKTSAHSLLFGCLAEERLTPRVYPQTKPTRLKYSKAFKDGVKARLLNLLKGDKVDSMSWQKVARTIGVKHFTCKGWFPEIARQVIARHRQFIEKRSQQRRADFCVEMKNVAISRIAEGKRLSLTIILRHLQRWGLIGQPWVQREYARINIELNTATRSIVSTARQFKRKYKASLAH